MNTNQEVTLINNIEPKQDKFKNLNWLLWWRLDRDEIDQQAKNYKKMNFIDSARGRSLLLQLLTALGSIIFVVYLDMSDILLIEAFIAVVLGIFIYYGHRWAIIAAMIFWTLGKGSSLIDSANQGKNIFVPILWWSIYMHIFYFALKVENARRALS